MSATRITIQAAVSHIGAPPKSWIETYSHQVPAPKVPAPNANPSSAARCALAPDHWYISTAGHRMASGQYPNGANPSGSNAPASTASASGPHGGTPPARLQPLTA